MAVLEAAAGGQAATRALELVTVDGLEEFSRREEWDALVRQMPRPSPFMLHGWLSAWWRRHGAGVEVAVHTVRQGGRLVGALPLYTERRRGLRTTRLLGGRGSALGDLLVSPDASDEVERLLGGAVESMRHDVLWFSGLDASSRLASALPLRLQERVESPVLDLTEGWQAVYRAKTNSRKRKVHGRRLRRLAELGRLELTVARTADELLPALEDAFAVHEARWRGQPDTSGFSTPAGRAFHRDAIAQLAADDVPRIATLKVGGRPIAFQLCFELEGRLYMHRLAFDPDFAPFSPGILTMLSVLEAAAGEGVHTVEYLGAGELYKLEWADRLEPLHDAVATGSALGSAHVRLELAGIRLRRRAKRSRVLRWAYFDGLGPLRRLRSGRTARGDANSVPSTKRAVGPNVPSAG
jgi:CelD/BcsL family acetyltransferase involved in cellulose biosynthesis